MALEIERRFIARVDQALLARAERMEMRQGYLTVHDATTVRIRQEGDAWILAVKVDAEGIARHEIEIELPEDDGRTLLALAAGGKVRKTRYTLGRWEIDVFGGRFEGLTLAEVELESESEPLPDAPAGLELIREITSEPGLSSRGLAALSRPKARKLVEKLVSADR